MSLLGETIKLIEAGWCQGDFAQASGGHLVSFTDQHAKKFCVNGAILRAVFKSRGKFGGMRMDRLVTNLDKEVRRKTKFVNLFTFNDDQSTTKSDVLGFLKECQQEHPDW